jgi:replicative DNA helicase
MSDIERRLLGRLLSAEAIAEAWDWGVRAEQFEEPIYHAIFDWTVDYWQKSRMASAPTPWVLEQEFHGYKPAENVVEEVFELAVLLRRRYLTNQLQTMLRKAAADSVLNPEEALKNLHAEAYAASEVVAPRVTRVNMADNIEERRSWYGAHENELLAGTAPFGVDLLDDFTGRIRPGELAVVGAFAKTGKTHFLCNAAVAAVKEGMRPVLFTLEVSLKDIQQRLDAFFSEVSYNQLIHDRLPINKIQQLWNAQAELQRLGGVFVERPEPGERTVAHLIARTRQLGGDYLLIDQLSRLEPGRETWGTKETRAVVLDQLHSEISRGGSEVPCFMAVQMRRGDAEPTLESFADAAEVEREVDIAVALWRNMELRRNGQMKCKILGSRRSDITDFLLNWELTTFTAITGHRELRGAP